MNDFQGFDDRNNGAGITGALAGILAGTGTFLLGVREWWTWGWGPWDWSGSAGKSDTIHSYWLAFFGHLKPAYKGDLGTWGSFESWLRNRHQYDAFVASFWVPFLVGSMLGLLVGFWVFRSMNRKGAAYLRGGRFN